jgi:hypothetical protein
LKNKDYKYINKLDISNFINDDEIKNIKKINNDLDKFISEFNIKYSYLFNAILLISSGLSFYHWIFTFTSIGLLIINVSNLKKLFKDNRRKNLKEDICSSKKNMFLEKLFKKELTKLTKNEAEFFILINSFKEEFYEKKEFFQFCNFYHQLNNFDYKYMNNNKNSIFYLINSFFKDEKIKKKLCIHLIYLLKMDVSLYNNQTSEEIQNRYKKEILKTFKLKEI